MLHQDGYGTVDSVHTVLKVMLWLGMMMLLSDNEVAEDEVCK
jgi:hypothetical protein